MKLIWIATSISVKRHVAHGVGDGNCIILNRNYLRHSNWDNVKVLLRSLLIRVEGKNVKLAFSQIHFQLTSYFSLTPYKIIPRKWFCMLFFFFLAQLELDENFFFAFWATFHCWCFFYYSFFFVNGKIAEERREVARGICWNELKNDGEWDRKREIMAYFCNNLKLWGRIKKVMLKSQKSFWVKFWDKNIKLTNF